MDSWVSRATRLACYMDMDMDMDMDMVPRCWVPHNPVHLSIVQVAGNLDPDRYSWPKPIGKGNRWVLMGSCRL